RDPSACCKSCRRATSLSSSPLPPPPPPHPRLEQMSQCQAMDFGQMFSQMGKLDGDLGKHGMDMKQLVDDAAQYALKDDWRCMDGSPSCGALPGLRYGASVEIRPRLLVLPCPCAGGQWTPPVANSDDGILQADGLWAARVPWRQQHRPSHPAGTEEDWLEADGQEGNPVVSANPLMSIFSSFGAMGAKLGKQLRRLVAGTPRPTSMMLGSIVGKQLRSLVGNPKYYPGSEPYAMDYGCAKGPVSKAFDGIQPGKRWWNSPKYGTVIVTTPCPCALGAWTGMQTGPQARPPASHAEDRTFESPDKAQEVPAWQQPQSMSLSSCAAASPEAAGTFALGVPCRAGAARCGSGARRGSRGGTAPGPGGPRRRRAAAFL
ncbi:unnamed protein product, partial [Prorocentrum cordatum]